MMCQDCEKRPAIIHFVSDINGTHQDLKLCAECAKKRRQAFSGAMSFAINMNDLLAGFYKAAQSTEPDLTCPVCGMTSSQLQDGAKLGCQNCYQVFDEWLEPVMRRIHGRTEHQGKIPGRSGASLQIRRQLDELRRKQQAAIAEERFESAAELRDAIKALEQQLSAQAEEAGAQGAGMDARAEARMNDDAAASAAEANEPGAEAAARAAEANETDAETKEDAE